MLPSIMQGLDNGSIKDLGKVSFELRNLLDQKRPVNETRLREGITEPQVS